MFDKINVMYIISFIHLFIYLLVFHLFIYSLNLVEVYLSEQTFHSTDF